MANPGILRFSRLGRILLLLVFAAGLQGCIYSKPSYSGRILDAETELPLRGVVVTASYTASSFGIVDTASKGIDLIKVKTDESGYFKIPSVFRIMGPLSWENDVLFDVYKYGYTRVQSIGLGECLSSGCDEKEIDVPAFGGKYYFSTNLIRLSKIRRRRLYHEHT